MEHAKSFADVLESVDQLSAEDQEALVEIVRRRASERGRLRLAAEAQEAQRAYEAGGCRPTTADDLMDEILS